MGIVSRKQLRKYEEIFADVGIRGSSAGLHRFQRDAFAGVR
jgi:hypothetical protein